jgi:perosamine synthetase
MRIDYKIPLSSPDISAVEKAAVLSVLDTPSLSLGPKVEEFENAFAAVTGARCAIAVNSGTSGLHLCIKAAGIGPGDEVITTPFSFVASANCILYEQATPVFADIDPATYNLDPEQVAAKITDRTRAILAVHVFGRPCDMGALEQLARRHGLALIEDACEALGAQYGGRPVGTFGQTGVFAFYPNKQITTGEGGMIVTNDGTIRDLCRSWRNQGRGDDGGWLLHQRLGYNYRLSDIHCALGLAQLSRLGEILDLRARIARQYSNILRQKLPELLLPPPAAPNTTASWFVYVVRLPDTYSREDRDNIIRSLRSQGVGCAAYFSPIHLQPFYRLRFGYQPGDYPRTERIAGLTLALPFFNRIASWQIERVCDLLAAALADTPARASGPGIAGLTNVA